MAFTKRGDAFLAYLRDYIDRGSTSLSWRQVQDERHLEGPALYFWLVQSALSSIFGVSTLKKIIEEELSKKKLPTPSIGVNRTTRGCVVVPNHLPLVGLLSVQQQQDVLCEFAAQYLVVGTNAKQTVVHLFNRYGRRVAAWIVLNQRHDDTGLSTVKRCRPEMLLAAARGFFGAEHRKGTLQEHYRNVFCRTRHERWRCALSDELLASIDTCSTS